MPFIAYGSLHFQKLLAPRYAAVREQVGILNGMLSNNLSGIATIKSFTAEEHEASALIWRVISIARPIAGLFL